MEPELENPHFSQSDTSPTSPNARRHKRARTADENKSRASKACDGCRRLKEKCEGGVPCKRCLRSRKVCSFSQTPARNPNGSTTDVPAVNNDERLEYLEQIAIYFLGNVSTTLPNLKRMVEKIQTSQVKTGENVGQLDADDLEDLTFDDDKFVLKTLSNNTAHYSGEFSHWNFSQKIQRKVNESIDESAATNIEGTIKKYFRATQLQSSASDVSAVLDFLPPHHVTDFLVQIYFQYAETNTFFVKESWVREKLEILHNSLTSITSNDASWMCTVLMVLACGTQFAHMTSGPQNNEDPVDENDPLYEHDIGVNFYHMATKLIPDVITIASLESVQACLLLAHYTLPLDTQGLAYTYLGLSMKMAIQNGMHRKYNGVDFSAVTIETRNRLWWTVYTLEKRISVLHGRPMSICPADVDADLPLDLEEFVAPEQTSKFANMTALIHLTVKLGEILNAITLLRRCPKRLKPTYFEQILEIRQQLRSWWSSLPSLVTCRDLSVSSPLFRPNVHLNLCFHLNEIFIGRAFIFSDSKGLSPPQTSNASTISGSPLSARLINRSVLVSDAVNAALQIIKLLGLLQEHSGLARASYVEFSSCRAALLVILAQSLNEETQQLRDALPIGMKLIKQMAIGIDSAKSEVSVIEALDTAIRQSRSNNLEREVGWKEDKSEESGYSKFKSWATLWKGAQSGSRGPLEPPHTSQTRGPIVDESRRGIPQGDAITFDNFAPGIAATMDDTMAGFGFGSVFSPSFLAQGEADTASVDWQEDFSGMEGFGMGIDSEPGVK